MEVEVRVERLGIEVIDRGSVFPWDMALVPFWVVTHGLADHRPVLAFSQSVIVGLAGARLGKFHA